MHRLCEKDKDRIPSPLASNFATISGKKTPKQIYQIVGRRGEIVGRPLTRNSTLVSERLVEGKQATGQYVDDVRSVLLAAATNIPKLLRSNFGWHPPAAGAAMPVSRRRALLRWVQIAL
jgi:hypothetical protein